METTLPMQGQVVLITGATSGIGRAAALALARQGATLVLVGRDEARCQATQALIQREASDASVAYLLADLSSQAQVRSLAEQFLGEYERLDVLINNAGAAFLRRQVSVDGIEMTLALNHLAYFLLTNLLLERLEASAPARVINVTSGAHRNAHLDFDDLEMRRGYRIMRAYGRSKLANILFTYELARRLEGSGVTANAAHPGWVATNIGRNNGWLMKWIMPLVQRGAKTPEQGADTLVYLASDPEAGQFNGRYFVDREAVPSAPASYDEDSARRLWDVSSQMAGWTANP